MQSRHCFKRLFKMDLLFYDDAIYKLTFLSLTYLLTYVVPNADEECCVD